ncbi:MAG: hypothetical protein JXX14_26330 [Deltaproteobacteria bacterium]|nr:hypothetical protein [Deltaproteobacteria bacterium]
MKYLKKSSESEILKAGLKYIEGRSNTELRRKLLEEQNGYCAYSEKRVSIEDTDVEHFNSNLKNGDDYYNYYAVGTSVHRRKTRIERTEKFRGRNTDFFKTLFFQTASGFGDRIGYFSDDHIYEELELNDTDAQLFIEFLSMNDPELVKERKRHIERLQEISAFVNIEEYLMKYPEEANFPTALEAEFDILL